MEPAILIAAFIGANIWGIFGPVPFTNINPTRTFLDRFLGSVQITSTIWALQEIHPKVFPEILLEDPRRKTIGPQAPFITPKTQDVLRTVTEFVTMMTAPYAPYNPMNETEIPDSVTQSTNLALIPSESAYSKAEFVFPFQFDGLSENTAVIYMVTSILVLFIIAWNVQRKLAKRGSKKVELDSVLLTELVGTLKEEFKYRIPQDDEDVDTIARRANIAGILELVEIPPSPHLENNTPTIGALIDVTQRVTRLEELLKMIFPYTAPNGASGAGGASPETAGQPVGQGSIAARKAKFDQTMQDLDQGIKNYNQMAAEIDTIKRTMENEATKQEWTAKDIKELQSELGRLHSAMVCITGDDEDKRLVLSEDEKSDFHRYTDLKVQQSNVAWQAKYTELADRLDEQNKKMESSMLSDVPLIKKRQTDGFLFLNKKIEDFRMTPSNRLFKREELVALIESILPRNPTIQALIQRANATKRAIGIEGEKIHDLKAKIDHAGFATALLTAENAKVWEVLGTTSESSSGATGYSSEASNESKLSGTRQPATAAVGSNAPSPTTTPSEETKKGKKPRSPNLYDAETDPESDKSERHDGKTEALQSRFGSQGVAERAIHRDLSIFRLPSASEGPSCNVDSGPIDEGVLAAQRVFMGSSDSRSDKPQDKGKVSTAPAGIQANMEKLAEKPEQPLQSAMPQEEKESSTAPQSSTSPQVPKPSRNVFDPSAYGLKKHMEKTSSQHSVSPFGKKDSPKPQAGKPFVQNNPWVAAQGGVRNRSLPFDPSKFGPRKLSENIPTYPPAGTKKDYQPRTPKTRGPDQKNDSQGRGQHASRGGHIGQHPPSRQSATAEEQKKLQGWNTFGQTARVKERKEEERILAEAKKDTNQKTVAWTANLTWKPKNAPSEEAEAHAAKAERRRSEPNFGREFAGEAQTEAEVDGPGLEVSIHAIPGAVIRRADGKETPVPPRRNSAGQ